MLRRVERDEESVVKASAVFGLSRPSFYNAMRAFRSEGMEGLAARPPGPRGPHKLNEEVMALVERTLMENDGISFLDVAALIKEVFEVSVHPRSIERALRRKKNGMSVPTAGQGRFSPDDEACAEYETLRDYALGTARDAAVPEGFALVIQRGLLYWHDAWSESKKAVNPTREFRHGHPDPG